MTATATITIVRSTAKAHLIQVDGAQAWIKASWLRADGSLTPAGIKAVDSKLEEKRDVEENGQLYIGVEPYVERETEKAILVKLPFESDFSNRIVSISFWLPKSQLVDGYCPEWLFTRKQDEAIVKFRDHAGYDIFARDILATKRIK